MKKTLLIGLPLALVLLSVGLYQAIWVAPTEATMGEIQRIFYYHFPSAIMALLFPYINFIASLVFLSTRNSNPPRAQAADALALASAEMTLIFCSIGLATGMLWARPVWGIWWTWDERLTSFLMLWLIYVSYLLLRRFHRRRTDADSRRRVVDLRGHRRSHRLYVDSLVAHPASLAGHRRRRQLRSRSQHVARGLVESGRLVRMGRDDGHAALQTRAETSDGTRSFRDAGPGSQLSHRSNA